jgi:hypothetical protein
LVWEKITDGQIFAEELYTMKETLGFSSPLSELYRQKREQLKQECYQHFLDQTGKCGIKKCFNYHGLEDFKQLCQVRDIFKGIVHRNENIK